MSRSVCATARSNARPAKRPRGSEHSFAGTDDIVAKFRKLARGVMAGRQQDALIEAVLRLDDLPDSLALTQLLCIS